MCETTERASETKVMPPHHHHHIDEQRRRDVEGRKHRATTTTTTTADLEQYYLAVCLGILRKIRPCICIWSRIFMTRNLISCKGYTAIKQSKQQDNFTP